MSKIFFIGNLGYGGASKIFTRVANYLSNDNVVKLVNFGFSNRYYQVDPKVEFLNVSLKKPSNILRKLYNIAYRLIYVCKLTLKERPDLLIAFENTEKLIVVIASILCKNTKCILSERRDPYNYKPGKRNFMYWRYNHADGVVFQTREASLYFSDNVRVRSTVIPNFIDEYSLPRIQWEDRNNEISFVGRFDIAAKRQDIMLKAFKKVYEKHPEYTLVFYGGGAGVGESMDLIKGLTKELNLESNVVFAGVVSPITDYISKSKIFAITSVYEGVPNALLEAMTCGLPVVSTDCSPGGARSLIDNNINGKLVPVDDIDAIANAILTFIDDPEYAESCGIKAKEDMRKYLPENVLPLWRDYINQVLSLKRH